jgi:hypothetical protein
MPPVGVSASPGMWAKARRYKLGAWIRLLCGGDGAVSNETIMNSPSLTRTLTPPPAHRTGLCVPTHYRTPDAPRCRFFLARDVGDGQKKQTRCIDSPVVRRRSGVTLGDNGVFFHGFYYRRARRLGRCCDLGYAHHSPSLRLAIAHIRGEAATPTGGIWSPVVGRNEQPGSVCRRGEFVSV